MPAIAPAYAGMTWLLGPTTPRYAVSGFYIETGSSLGAAAIDARHRTCPRWHDMAAGMYGMLERQSCCRKTEKHPNNL